MKHTLFILIWIWCSSMYAQHYSVRRERNNNDYVEQTDSLPIKQKAKLTINKSIGVSFNYTHLHNKIKGDKFVEYMGQDLIGADVNIFLLYMGFDLNSKYTGHVVYGFKEQVNTFVLRIGPSLWYGTDKGHFGFTPFIEFCNVKVDDTSHNSIGARTYYDTHANKTGFGIKLSYSSTLMEMGLRISSLGIGVSFGVSLPVTKWF